MARSEKSKAERRSKVLESIKKHGWIFDKEWINRLIEIGLTIGSHHGYPTLRAQRFGKSKRIMVARMITNCPKGLTVDHKNRNKKDNRVRNLRVVTQAENNRNRGLFLRDEPCALCNQVYREPS